MTCPRWHRKRWIIWSGVSFSLNTTCTFQDIIVLLVEASGIPFRERGAGIPLPSSMFKLLTLYALAVILFTTTTNKNNTVKINFIAIDFDQTIINIHTGGKWTGNGTDLAQHVRPIFKHFINAASAADMKLAVVTFSPQVGYVSEVMKMHFPRFADTIVIRGRDGSWKYQGAGSHSGKQGHMASAVEELGARYADVDITKKTTLLIDDDAQNCRIALLDGVRAVWLNPMKPDRLFKNVMNLS
mmetsp:Transcript_38092/g.77527  ORF Transcript_38092/g.77527 Transcript_38092/m.77527 type:complete len:242 (-) Transcript_38092:1048-1773(-)